MVVVDFVLEESLVNLVAELDRLRRDNHLHLLKVGTYEYLYLPILGALHPT